MLCPIDQTVLAVTERQGVEIDYCPTCRGVWLDRGELDKIIERAAGDGRMPGVQANVPRGNLERQADTRQPSNPVGRFLEGKRADEDDDDYDERYQGSKPRKKKKGSFLEDLFDF